MIPKSVLPSHRLHCLHGFSHFYWKQTTEPQRWLTDPLRVDMNSKYQTHRYNRVRKHKIKNITISRWSMSYEHQSHQFPWAYLFVYSVTGTKQHTVLATAISHAFGVVTETASNFKNSHFTVCKKPLELSVFNRLFQVFYMGPFNSPLYLNLSTHLWFSLNTCKVCVHSEICLQLPFESILQYICERKVFLWSHLKIQPGSAPCQVVSGQYSTCPVARFCLVCLFVYLSEYCYTSYYYIHVDGTNFCPSES